MATKAAAVPFLVAMMLLTGICNTLLTKYQDMQCVRGCKNVDVKSQKHFEQPVLQTLQMFIGEMGCWLVVAASAVYQRFAASRGQGSERAGGYEAVGTAAMREEEEDDDDTIQSYHEDTNATIPAEPLVKPQGSLSSRRVSLSGEGMRRPLKGGKVFMLALPACCDIMGTTLMNLGLLFVAASIYQMTRGALVLFVGLFSVWFLHRRLGATKWLALFVVVAGVAVVGLAGVIEAQVGKGVEHRLPGKHDKPDLRTPLLVVARVGKRTVETVKSPEALSTLVGILCIAAAQIFTATQFVLEESIMHNYELDPLLVVSYEGTFGFLITLLGMIVLYFTIGMTDAGRYGYFDAKEGFREVLHDRAIAISSVLIMISIGGFNFFGLSVTHSVSATARSTIDTCRTLGIWLVSLGLGWESFKWLQVVGFALLVYGTFLFNDIITLPTLRNWTRQDAPLLVDEEQD